MDNSRVMSSSSSGDRDTDALSVIPLLSSTPELMQRADLAAAIATSLVLEEVKIAAGGDSSLNPLLPNIARFQSLMSGHGSILSLLQASAFHNGRFSVGALFLFWRLPLDPLVK